MKYETRETTRITENGGTETVTESVPVYSKREQRAMARHEKRSHSGGTGGKKKKSALKNPVLRFIFMNPQFLLILLGLLVVFVVYMVASADAYMTQLIKTYTSLSAKPTGSQDNFDKRLFFIVVNDDGTKSIVVGAKSEEELKDVQQAVEEAGGGDAPPDNSGFDSDLEQFIADVQSKDSSLRTGTCTTGYYVMKNTNDLSLTAAAMGNSQHEATLGQWQIKSKNITLSSGNYTSNYSGKTSIAMGQTCADLYKDLVYFSKNNEGIGWGPTQCTYPSNYTKYVSAMDSLKISTSTEKVTESYLKQMEAIYVNLTFNLGLRNDSTQYMKNMQYSVNDVYEEISRSDPGLINSIDEATAKSVIKDTIYIIANYERFSNYSSNKSSGVTRSTSALRAYVALQEVKGGK